MTWRFLTGPHTLDQLAGLPPEARPPVLALIERLEEDPYRCSAPFGHDDGLTREAVFGDWGTMVVLCNPDTCQVTMLAVAWTG
ncbi:hypothetical protein [Streptomyces sp. NPDC003077]|uniref:hypothetical protein n=1 Tax=Streptomyces sp. NPDC003077 TaxID=3154443 RepID=UPI00339ED21A